MPNTYHPDHVGDGYFVPLDMKGCICHFTKWRIHPFISKGTTSSDNFICLLISNLISSSLGNGCITIIRFLARVISAGVTTICPHAYNKT